MYSVRQVLHEECDEQYLELWKRDCACTDTFRPRVLQCPLSYLLVNGVLVNGVERYNVYVHVLNNTIENNTKE